MSAIHYDPFDPRVRADPFPVYTALRHRAPVHRIESLDLWTVSRYADVSEALHRPALFSSAAMRELLLRPDLQKGRTPEELEQSFPETLLGSDPPAHTRLRKIVNRGFTRHRIAALEPRIRAIAAELLGRFEDAGGCELVSDFAAPLPVRVIAELLGIDPERHDDFKRWSDHLLLLVTGSPSPAQARECRRSLDALDDHLDRAIEERRRRPGGDLISALVAAEAADGTLTADEVSFFAFLLLVAGNETTTNLIANAVIALLEHPQQLRLLAANPALLPRAVEEVLRFASPVQLTLRRATRDVRVAGVAVPAGANLALLLGSANRDESVFPRADRFDVTRDATGHLAFGHGTHFCLGAPLARLEARIALETLLARTREPCLDEERIDYVPSLLVRGPRRLRVRFAGGSVARRSA